MRTSDVIRMAVHNIWQRRVRTLFNLAGIVTGCIVLLMTAAGTSGVRNAIYALFDSSDFARQIYIFPGGHAWQEPPEGEIVIDAKMSESRRERIRKALIVQWNQQRRIRNTRHEITTDDLDSIRKIPHVLAVLPEATSNCVIKTDTGSLPTGAAAINIHSRTLEDGLLAGAVPDVNDREGVLIDEFLAWQLGFRNDADLPKLIGKPLNIEYLGAKQRVANIYNLLTTKWGEFGIDEIQKQTKFLQTLFQLMGDLDKTTLTDEQKSQLRELLGAQTTEVSPEVTETQPLIVRGIVHSGQEDPVTVLFRQWFHDENRALLIHPDLAREIYQRQNNSGSFFNALVVVESSSHLRDVSNALQAEHYQPHSSLAALEHIDYQIDRSAWIVYGIALAILLTSVVGILNTLTMSIVERTPEFGIMKSIGARDSDVLKLMIAEGATLGVIGAMAAILLSLMIGACGQSLLAMYVESRTQTEIAGKLFQFQIFPAVLILLISISLCIIASLLPAWRAAKLDPVVAMRRT